MPDWKDSQPFTSHFGDEYFPTDPGLEETRHVFVQGNELERRFAEMRAGESFCIGETGFGSGLNFLCTWQLFEQIAPSDASLDFFSTETSSIDDESLGAALALLPELASQVASLLSTWRRRVPGWNRWHFANGRVRLTLAMEGAAQALSQLPPHCVDAWFLESFSHLNNPEMRGNELLTAITRASHAGTTLATNPSADWFQPSLQEAGFEVKKSPSHDRKREMAQCRLASSDLQSSNIEEHTPRTVLVIGGGLAGCAAAHALAQRGIKVTLIESASQLASAASGNPRGILHARFGAGMDTLHRFVLAAYGHALALLDEVVPVDGVHRAECGLLQLAATASEAKRIGKLAMLEWPPHLLQAVDTEQASTLAGLPMAHGGLWFPAGGWVVPSAVCANLVQHPNITVRLESEVTSLVRTASGWCARGEGFAIEAKQAVVCSAYHAKQLAQFAALPLLPVRGQISVLAATEASCKMQAVLCAEGYCAPAVAGQHVAGATSSFNDDGTDIRESDHAENIAKLSAHMPMLMQALGGSQPLSGRAGVRCSVPGATPLVGEVESGLYCSLAHGTRGLLTVGLAGEVIAAGMCGTLSPLPKNLLDALAPLRRLARRG